MIYRLLFIACISLGGCAALEDYHYSAAARHRADEAWRLAVRANVAARGSADYASGWKQGYFDVSTGSDGEPPAVPPRQYWTAEYQNARGQAAVQNWFAGYQDGATAAQESGAGAWHAIPTGPSVPLGPSLGPLTLLPPIEARAADPSPPGDPPFVGESDLAGESAIVGEPADVGAPAAPHAAPAAPHPLPSPDDSAARRPMLAFSPAAATRTIVRAVPMSPPTTESSPPADGPIASVVRQPTLVGVPAADAPSSPPEPPTERQLVLKPATVQIAPPPHDVVAARNDVARMTAGGPARGRAAPASRAASKPPAR